jgi:microcystin-dependent protein
MPTTSKNLGQIAAIIAGPTPPANTNVIWLDTSGTQSVKKNWDPIALAWIPITQSATVAGDNWGSQVAITDTTLIGNGVVASPLGIGQQGATVGQVLKWNGTTWVPQNENPGGIIAVAHDSTLSGNGTVGGPLTIAQQAAMDKQVLTWNALLNSWIPQAPQIGTVLASGIVLMWSGSITAIPAGFLICDGTNGTPNLQGMFIVGYNPNDGDYNAIGKTGGLKTVSLTAAQNGTHNHGVNDPGHAHQYSLGNDKGGNSYGSNWAKLDSNTNTRNTANAVTGITTQNSGNGAPHENRPPYFVLAYIMKQ